MRVGPWTLGKATDGEMTDGDAERSRPSDGERSPLRQEGQRVESRQGEAELQDRGKTQWSKRAVEQRQREEHG